MDQLEFFKKDVENLTNNIDKMIFDYCDQIRTALVVPLCKKYKIKFDAGMGAFSFSKNGDNIFKNFFTENKYGDDLWDAMDFLELGFNNIPNSLGSYMDNYPKK